MIYHGMQKSPRRACAVKQLPYAVDEETFADVVREIKTMRRLVRFDELPLLFLLITFFLCVCVCLFVCVFV